MSHRIPDQSRQSDSPPLDPSCPSWCVAPHGLHNGEEDWIHLSEPLWLLDRLRARLCMTVDQEGRTLDGPHVVIGSAELSPAETNELGLALQALASAAEETTRRAAS